ncbi:MAG: prephenate dehydrogenase/arogenate dehydrogenase family protein, partial [Bacteroidales bacterium]|nr:prephenate dehydrogenase/arogenate dehydrogenase family protein [Bacteroidales bacterium]
MRILILGAGKMGMFLADTLCMEHDVAVYARRAESLRYCLNVRRFLTMEEIEEFNPELLINCVTIKNTLTAFEQVLPHIGKDCVLSDIASVKTGLPEFYANCGHRYVSTHPMFGPTFANLADLSQNYAIIIKEGDTMGKAFFREVYASLKLNIYDYSFEEHDETIAYSLSIPFVSTLAFTGVMKPQDAPGTTFKKHMAIARGLLGEDDYLLTEILFNPNSPKQIDQIIDRLKQLSEIIKQ